MIHFALTLISVSVKDYLTRDLYDLCYSHSVGLPWWHCGKLLTLRVGDQEINPCFLCTHHTSDLKIGTLESVLPDAWHYWVSTETGWPTVRIL